MADAPTAHLLLADPTLRIAVRLAMVVACWLLARLVLAAVLRSHGRARGLSRDRVRGMQTTLNRLLFLAAASACLMIGGVEMADITAVLGTFLALVGMALFATWSVLSNITASLILYLHRDIHLSDTVRILDGDSSVEGVIIEFGAFALVLRRSDGAKVVYPNNLAIQRPIIRVRGGDQGSTSLAIPAQDQPVS